MDTAAFQRDLDRTHQRFPVLRSPMPPVPADRPVDGVTSSLSAPEVFSELAEQVTAGRYRLPRAAMSFEHLIGPFNAIGYCIDPLVTHGDQIWIDPAMPARDGDVVLVQWHARTLEAIIRRGAKHDEWLTMYGDQPPPLAVKLLKHVGGERFLATRQSVLELGRNKILGVVRRVTRAGRSLYDDVELAPAIDPNAASQIASAYTGSFFSLSCAGGATADTDVITLSFTANGFPVAIDIAGQVGGSRGGSPATCTSAIISAYRNGTQVASSSYDATSLVNSASAGGNSLLLPVVLSITDSPAAGTYTYTLHLHLTASGAGSTSCAVEFNSAFMKLREIKR